MAARLLINRNIGTDSFLYSSRPAVSYLFYADQPMPFAFCNLFFVARSTWLMFINHNHYNLLSEPTMKPDCTDVLTHGEKLRRIPYNFSCHPFCTVARPTLLTASKNNEALPHSELTKIAVTLAPIATMAQTG